MGRVGASGASGGSREPGAGVEGATLRGEVGQLVRVRQAGVKWGKWD